MNSLHWPWAAGESRLPAARADERDADEWNAVQTFVADYIREGQRRGRLAYVPAETSYGEPYLQAVTLLATYLTAAERAHILVAGYLAVQAGGKCFEINAWTGAVRTRDQWGDCGYCIRPINTVPAPDVVLAQKWLLEAVPKGWQRTAKSIQAWS